MFLKMYPVGAIYMSVDKANPATLFGGTWVSWGSGRVPVGVDTSDPNFNETEKAGGSASHAHASPQHTHGINAHSHTMAHTHTINDHAHSMSHTHTINDHAHAGPYHNHGFDGSARMDLNAAGKMYVGRKGNITSWDSNVTGTMTRGANEGAASHSNVMVDGTVGYGGNGTTGGSGVLTSNVSSIASTYGSGALTSNGSSAANTGGETLTTNSNAVANTGSASTLSPYITCYMWKRMA